MVCFLLVTSRKKGRYDMSPQCVLVADGARARLFTIDAADDSGRKEITEHRDFANPAAELTGKQLFANLKSGRHRAPAGGPAYGYDDHRDQHRDEIVRRFARYIADETAEFIERSESSKLIVLAPPRMLGILRAYLGADVQTVEIADGLGWRSSKQVREALERHGILKPKPRAGMYRSRGQVVSG